MEIPNSATVLHDAQSSLLLEAAAVVRRRYVYCVGDASLSPTEAEELAKTLETIARNGSGFDDVERKVAIGLAHRVIDDDHPELSRMWPT